MTAVDSNVLIKRATYVIIHIDNIYHIWQYFQCLRSKFFFVISIIYCEKEKKIFKLCKILYINYIIIKTLGKVIY